MFSDKVLRWGQPSLLYFRHSPILFAYILSSWESLFLGKAGCKLRAEPYTFLLIYYGFCFSEQNWCEFFADWKDTPMNFCNKKFRYSLEGCYQIAQLDSKVLTLSSTQYHENRTHTSSWRTSVINVYVACSYMTFLGLLLKVLERISAQL